MRPSLLQFGLTGLLSAFSALAQAGSPSLVFHFDHFGYRPSDTKRLLMTVNPGATVQIRDAGSNAVVFTVPTDGGSIASLGVDANAGQAIWRVDFSPFSAAGSYYFYANALTYTPQSYPFDLNSGVYNAVALTALKAFYYQRCNVSKPALYAGNWSDSAACHLGDASCAHLPGQPDYGVKDLRGGWHDAGDYNKYAWYAAADSVYQVLQAWEDNPAAFTDAQTNIPESGNGLPDVLDEMQVEADWLLKMQLPDGRFLDRVKAPDNVYTTASPPSADATVRYYRDPTAESCGIGTGTLARAAYAFALAGQSVKAAQYKAAALAGWGFLALTTTTDETRVWAAAEIVHLDGVATTTSARAYVDSVGLGSPYLDPDHWTTWAAITYAESAAATPAQVTAIKSNIGGRVSGLMTTANNPYGQGMDTWQYYWGSNRPRAKYGLFLQQAAKLGGTALAGYSAAQLKSKSQDFLHYFHGLNALNFVYLTNVSSIGGEHSCYQMYHGWFGIWGDSYITPRFIGKPTSVSEPNYPYYAGTDNNGVSDNNSSLYGPAPGILPGGVNFSYSGSAVPPSAQGYRDLAFRDFCDMSTFSAVTWEITEPSLSTQGPYVALASYFMSAALPPTPTPTVTPSASASPSATPSPTPSQTVTPTASATPCPACSPTTTATVTLVSTATPLPAGSLPRLYPNPVTLDAADPNTRVLRFDGVEPGSRAEIFNLVGERVINLKLTGDYHRDAWDCVNANGAGVATGVYIVMIKQPSGKTSVQRMAVIRAKP